MGARGDTRLRNVNKLRMKAAESAPLWRPGRSKQGATNAMPRRKLFRRDSWEYGHDSAADEQPLAQPRKRRTATTVAYAALFFAGATFTAIAGDHFAQMTAPEDATSAATDSTSTDTTTAEATTTMADVALPAPATAAPADSSAPAQGAAADSQAPPADAQASDGPDYVTPNRSPGSSPSPQAGDASAASQAGSSAPAAKGGRGARKKPSIILLPATRPLPAPEIEGPASAATIWLNRALPDPTPPARRLSPTFARQLVAASKQSGVDWALLLGVLRAKGLSGRAPADKGTLLKLGTRLASLDKRTAGGAWATALAYDGTATFADRAFALARYDRAVGLNALVHGLEAAKTSLEQRLLNDPTVNIYAGGRDDIAKDKVDVRVLATIAYLRESFGSVTVSCLITGHRLYARPGVISAHIFGRAVDIAGLGGTPILGHQEPGGLTEQAVRDILLLPGEVMPRQVISLLGLGGPSFPLADHYNHIHIGW